MEVLPKSKSSSSASSLVHHERSWVKRLRKIEVTLRLLASVMAVVTLTVIVTDRQTKQIAFFPGFPTYEKARYSDVEITVVCVSSLGIAAGYSLVQTIRCLLRLPRKSTSVNKRCAWCTFLLDQVMTYFLLSASAAFVEMSYIAEKGIIHFSWQKVCNLFGRFCNQMGLGNLLSFLVTFILAITSSLSAYFLFSAGHKQ